MLCQIFDLILRHTQMIQPFFRDFLTSTLLHRLLDKVTLGIGKQAVYPYADLVFVLLLELPLTIDRPA